MNILALDIGTTSMRGILFDAAGEVLATETVQTPLCIQKDRVEQSPETFVRGTVSICKAIAARQRVDAISVTAFRSAITLVDAQGTALYPFIMWQDTRNSGICSRLRGEDAWVHRTSGACINTVFTATKIAWLKENEPELYHRAYKTMIVPDYVIRFMTGVFATDHTYGSRSLLMNIHTLEWDDALCALFGVDREKLCELRPQGAVAGTVNLEFARLTGMAQGTPVISAGGDQQCGALGLGVMDESTLEVNSGTGSFVISVADKPYLENRSILCNVAAVPGQYTLELNIISSASAVNWLVREFFPELGGEAPDFEAVNRIVAETPPGANGLICIPHFQGCGARDWRPEAKAGFWGFTLGTRRQDLLRALYEGIGAEIAKSIDALPDTCRQAKAIAAAGGLSNSDAYCQILGDMTGRSLMRCRNAQATAVGAFLSGAVAMGLYTGYPEALAAVNPSDRCRVFLPDAQRVAFYQTYQRKAEILYRSANEADGPGEGW